MAFNYSPKIVTDGLVLYLDAANTKSYPGSGTTWKDLSGNGYDGTLVNGPTFDSESGGNFLLDGVNDYAVLSGGATNNTHAWTADDSVGSSILCMELWIKTSDTAGRLISKPWNGSGQYNMQILPSNFSLLAGTTGTTSTNINYNSLATNTWRQLVIWATSTQIGYYIDGGIQQNTIPHSITGGVPTSGNSNLSLGLGTLYFYGSGWVGNTSFSINANIAMFRKYNRILSAQEVLQNYNATKTRFGLI